MSTTQAWKDQAWLIYWVALWEASEPLSELFSIQSWAVQCMQRWVELNDLLCKTNEMPRIKTTNYYFRLRFSAGFDIDRIVFWKSMLLPHKVMKSFIITLKVSYENF